MEADSVRYALAMIYVSLASAVAIATGKPVEELADHFMREMLDENAPAPAVDLLRNLIGLPEYRCWDEIRAFATTAH